MSYDIYLYDSGVKDECLKGTELYDFPHPVIPEGVRQRIAGRLLQYDYELESKSSDCTEYVHSNKSWSIQVAVFETEIAFSVPYWDNAMNAIIEAKQTAHELADSNDLCVFDPQTEEWDQ